MFFALGVSDILIKPILDDDLFNQQIKHTYVSYLQKAEIVNNKVPNLKNIAAQV
jgi:hypothetical protein